MKKTRLFLILACALLTGFTPVAWGQGIEIILPERTGKEILLRPPTFAPKPEPIPGENGLYRFTHFMAAVCTDDKTGESTEISQYLNINNGVVGLFEDNLLTMTKGDMPVDEGQVQLWAFLPNATQRMFATTKEQGKLLIQMTAGDGMQTTTMARFDAWNDSDMFWRTAKVVKKLTLPPHLIEGNAKPIPVEVYEATGPDGKVNVWLVDLGLATGQYAPLKTIHALTGLGGTGLIMNHRNQHVYLVFQVNNVPNTMGCRLLTFYPKKRQFSGLGYKPAGDLLLDRLTTGQRQQEAEHAQEAEAANDEEDAQLRELLLQKNRLFAEVQKKTTDGAINAAMLNDMTELTRSSAAMAMNVEDQYRMADVEMKIQQRRLEIELETMREDTGPDAEKRRRAIRQNLTCVSKQRDLWLQHRQNAARLTKQFEGRTTEPKFLENLGELSTRFYTRLAQICP